MLHILMSSRGFGGTCPEAFPLEDIITIGLGACSAFCFGRFESR